MRKDKSALLKALSITSMILLKCPRDTTKINDVHIPGDPTQREMLVGGQNTGKNISLNMLFKEHKHLSCKKGTVAV